ncbi:MAG: DUF6350 family protein [Bifidobacteriaceae bacterium]|jgi:hypothetical protein|nr:DUF6350 family protein [Bifidobacteriaceae bacterium]
MDQTARVTPASRPTPRGPAPTLAGLLVGVQAALLSWIVVVVPAVAAFTSTSALSYNAGVSWADAARVGSDVWVLGHFGSIWLGQGASRALVSLAPLGIPLVSVFACAALTHSTSARGWPLVGGGIVGFLAAEASIAAVISRAPAGSVWACLAGGAAAALIGLTWGNRPHGARLVPARVRAWAARAPAEVPVALAAAGALAAAVLTEGAVLVAGGMVGGQGRFRSLFAALAPDAVGAVALTLLGLALVPNALTWGVAYLSGAGFEVGSGSGFSPWETGAGGAPALPLFGFLPATAPPGAMAAVVAVPVLAAAVIGWLARRRLQLPARFAASGRSPGGSASLGLGRAVRDGSAYPGGGRTSRPEPVGGQGPGTGAGQTAGSGAAGAHGGSRPWWLAACVALAAGILAAAALALLAVLASGAAGPGRLVHVGVGWWPLFGWLSLELGLGAAAGALLLGRPWKLRAIPSAVGGGTEDG